jgi:hypothetical protein
MNSSRPLTAAADDAVDSVHADLVRLGARWLKGQGFGVVATELAVSGTQERADVIGFRSTCSAIIEAKASRADFLADRKKSHRGVGGLGNYRFYLCPPGIIEASDIPEGWGLLYADGMRVAEIVKPAGNRWPGDGQIGIGNWAEFCHLPDHEAERAVLYSIARRLSAA